MARFKTLPNRNRNKLPERNVKQLPKHATQCGVKRVTGRTLQARRLSMWESNPHCAICGRVVDYPSGFELDHIIPLADGGTDEPDNWQILCVWWESGTKHGCHNDKTNVENSGRFNPTKQWVKKHKGW